jgi:hypothetical protein
MTCIDGFAFWFCFFFSVALQVAKAMHVPIDLNQLVRLISILISINGFLN